ncbi:ORF 73 [Cryptosporidium sp. chipmunk genotype I]|uniref:ORF 73 n=1 Tax=Cryptosporidium sp. chipmunk genotype I TaxID=1280935 RepID=UPI00351A3811|nr:ORF 73 [Cryptosporidium sp. chipmunk genotype I]
MSLLSIQKLQGTLELGIATIENSTRKLVENETRKFEAYIDILRDQMMGMGELEHENEILQEEVAKITEQLSLRELDMESKEKKIFELEKCARDIQEMNKDYEKELGELKKEKNDLRAQLNEMNVQIEKLMSERITSGKAVQSSDEKQNTSKGKSKKRTQEEHGNENTSTNKVFQEAPTLKKSRLRRPQNEDSSESKKSIGKDADAIIQDDKPDIEENPLKDVLGKTNLGRLRAPLLRSRVVKAAEAANPEVENVPELKTLEKEKSGPGRLKKSSASVDSKKSGKKTSKVAKIAKIPHYDENILNSMKVVELKDVCSKLQLEINQRARKSDLIQLILSFQGE